MKQHKNFLNSIIQRIGRSQSNQKKPTPENIINLCHQLISRNGESTLFSLAKIVLMDFERLSTEQKKSFFLQLLEQFSVDRSAIEGKKIFFAQ